MNKILSRELFEQEVHTAVIQQHILAQVWMDLETTGLLNGQALLQHDLTQRKKIERMSVLLKRVALYIPSHDVNFVVEIQAELSQEG